MVWTVLAVLGIVCIVAAAYLFGGLALALLVAGLALLAVGIDGARPSHDGVHS